MALSQQSPIEPIERTRPDRLAQPVKAQEMNWAHSTGRRNTSMMEVLMGRPAGWTKELTGRSPMKSPGAPSHLSKHSACRAVGLSRSAYARTPIAQTPADPDADLRATLSTYAREHPLHGFRRAWAHLRHDQGVRVIKKKVHRLWKEEGLQVRIYHPRKRAGVSTIPQVEADAPKAVWALEFQFGSTVDGKAIKMASMLDEHPRLSLMNIVERSITAQKLTEELDKAFALWSGPPLVLRMDDGPEFISRVLQQFCGDRIGICDIPPGTPWNNGHIGYATPEFYLTRARRPADLPEANKSPQHRTLAWSKINRPCRSGDRLSLGGSRRFRSVSSGGVGSLCLSSCSRARRRW
ncbi:IS3 family transposase [Mycolicibacterium sp. Y3]